jgi:hypothetical protein
VAYNGVLRLDGIGVDRYSLLQTTWTTIKVGYLPLCCKEVSIVPSRLSTEVAFWCPRPPLAPLSANAGEAVIATVAATRAATKGPKVSVSKTYFSFLLLVLIRKTELLFASH